MFDVFFNDGAQGHGVLTVDASHIAMMLERNSAKVLPSDVLKPMELPDDYPPRPPKFIDPGVLQPLVSPHDYPPPPPK